MLVGARYLLVMRRDEVIALLTAHRAGLARFDVRRLSLFGSVARDEARPGSDVDLLVEFDGPATFARYTGLLAFLEDLLGGKVDLLTPRSVKARMAPLIERDLVRVA